MKTAARKAKTFWMSSGVAATRASSFIAPSRCRRRSAIGFARHIEMKEATQFVDWLFARTGEAVALETVQAAHGRRRRIKRQTAITLDAEPLAHQRDRERGELPR